MNTEEQLEYEKIFDVLQTRESSTLTLLSLFMSASFVIIGIIETLKTQQIRFPDWLLWMGLLLVLSSIVYRLVTSDFDNHCYTHLRELEKGIGALTWLNNERNKKRYVFSKWRGQIINMLLATLTAPWIVWILDWDETRILPIGVVAFAIISIADFIINDP